MSNIQAAQLSEKEQLYVDGLLAGKTATKAAHDAGYSNPTRDAPQVFADPRAVAYAYKKTRGRLVLEGAPAAYALMLRVMNDETRDMRLRIDVAKVIFSAAGYTAPKAPNAPDDGENSHSEMNAKDAERWVSRIQAELKRRAQADAQIIDVTPQRVPPQAFESML